MSVTSPGVAVTLAASSAITTSRSVRRRGVRLGRENRGLSFSEQWVQRRCRDRRVRRRDDGSARFIETSALLARHAQRARDDALENVTCRICALRIYAIYAVILWPANQD